MTTAFEDSNSDNNNLDMAFLSERIGAIRQKVDSGLELDDGFQSPITPWSSESRKLGERFAEIVEPYSFDLYITDGEDSDGRKTIELNCIHPLQVKAVRSVAQKLMVVLVHYHGASELTVSLNDEVVGSIDTNFTWVDIPVTSLLYTGFPDWIAIDELACRMQAPIKTLIELCESFGLTLKTHDPSAPEQLGLTQNDLFFLASGINFCTVEAMSTEVDKSESLRDD